MTLRWIQYHQFACKSLLSEPGRPKICTANTQVSGTLLPWLITPPPHCPQTSLLSSKRLQLIVLSVCVGGTDDKFMFCLLGPTEISKHSRGRNRQNIETVKINSSSHTGIMKSEVSQKMPPCPHFVLLPVKL